MDRAHFLDYLDAYNRGDFDRVATFYAPDYVFESFGVRRQGEELKTFLYQLHQTVRDRLHPLHFHFEGDTIVLDAEAEITALRDAPELPVGAMRAGESRRVPMQVRYRTRGDQFIHVVVAAAAPSGDRPQLL